MKKVIGLEKINSLSNNSIFLFQAKLEEVSINSAITSFGNGVFNRCESLTKINFSPTGNVSIGSETFYGCKLLPTSELEDLLAKATTIGSEAFRDCELLDDIVLGPNVTSIGEGAFTGCSSLETITFSTPAPPATLGTATQGIFGFYGNATEPAAPITNIILSHTPASEIKVNK